MAAWVGEAMTGLDDGYHFQVTRDREDFARDGKSSMSKAIRFCGQWGSAYFPAKGLYEG